MGRTGLDLRALLLAVEELAELGLVLVVELVEVDVVEGGSHLGGRVDERELDGSMGCCCGSW